jgi:hypothetical protein
MDAFPSPQQTATFLSFFMRMPLADGNSCWDRVWVDLRGGGRGGNNRNGQQLWNSVSSPETAFPVYTINEIFHTMDIIFSSVLCAGPENHGKKKRNSDRSWIVGRRESGTLQLWPLCNQYTECSPYII